MTTSRIGTAASTLACSGNQHGKVSNLALYGALGATAGKWFGNVLNRPGGVRVLGRWQPTIPTRATGNLPKLPAPQRQLSITSEEPALDGLSADQQAQAV